MILEFLSVNQYFVFRLDDHLNLFGHGMSKGGKVSGVQCCPEFSELRLQFIDIAGSRLWNLVLFKQLRAFSLGFRSRKLPGCLKHGC